MAGFTVTTVAPAPEPSAIYLMLMALSVVLIRVFWSVRKRALSRVI
jgi:PEP-CTERM motif